MLEKVIDNLKPQIIETLQELVKIPAIAPSSGGEGELKKADYIWNLISGWGFDDLKRYDCDKRPNIVAKIEGKKKQTLWIVTHLDIVPPGNLALWKTNPFVPVVKGDKIYGRGSEDNGQSLVASLYACKALLMSNKKPNYNIGLAIVSDEETGSKYGIEYLIKQGLFKKNDIILVPDAGNEKGNLIEVAEKAILWLKFTIKGRQCHASTPEKGINAFRASVILAYKLDKDLHKKFKLKNKLFSPPYSTFELTKKEANVPNINTIPGIDVFYIDCRVLPDYRLKDILRECNRIVKEVEKETGTKIKAEITNKSEASYTNPNLQIVKQLKKAIKEVYHVNAITKGIGGGTCAGVFRRAGYNAIVWSRVDEKAHAPNEYCRISNLIGDAKVYTKLFLS
ncbi:MAG: M20 family metallo-hydrolase [Candidatus Thermoplasmatota archaeon]|nr:M20 family metallo-hydrolase [Candidatus Thermoplasmatota archaeon]